jgi:tetratricopeptide (TPR) repeat protein
MTRLEAGPAAQDSRQASNDPETARASLAAALCQAGRQHMQAGRHLDAQLCCERALAADPGHVDAMQLMGLLALQARQYDHAIEWIARANQQDVRTDHLLSLGIALGQQGLHQEACKAYERALQLRPDDIELWGHHGNALAQLGQLEEALASHRQALRLDPAHADSAFRCGLLLMSLKRYEEALAYFNRCDELRPNHAAVLEQRGHVLHSLKRFDEAEADSRRAHALNPASAEVCNNIGASLQWLRRDEEALRWFDKALALRPDFITALVNKASSLAQTRRIDEAVATYNRVEAIDPDNADAKWNLSLLQLVTGDFEAGWAGREVRWKGHMRPVAYPGFQQQMWLGQQDIKGKTIIVYADEGAGDTIQFARYIPMLAERGAKVFLVVEQALHKLLSGLPGLTQCLAKPAQSLPPFDFHCPICSLPLAFATRLDTIPSARPYLPALSESSLSAWEQRLQERLGAIRKRRIGLVWSGNPRHANDHNRSAPLQSFLGLLDADADFVSLQRDPRADDKALLDASRIVDMTAHLTDFAETAALVSCLDLVITVDTSVAHLAGALGRPTWIVLPYMPDYRWLLDREDSPWYPTARLFRQTATRDWSEVIERVRGELAARAWSC